MLPLLPLLLLLTEGNSLAVADFPRFSCPSGQQCDVEMRSKGVRVASNLDPLAIRKRDVSREGALFISGSSTFEGPMEAGFTCHVWERSLDRPHWITGFAPLIDTSHDKDVIHHINLFGCTADVLSKVLPSLACATNVFMTTMRGHTGQLCKELMVPWDKGAPPFRFPEGKGMRVGPGSEHKYLMVQVHYLVPKGWPKDGGGLRDHTGMSVTLTSDAPGKQLGMIAFSDSAMALPPGVPSHPVMVELGVGQVKKHLHHDLQAFGRVFPVAVHLHAHSMGTALRLEHFRDGAKIGTILEIDPYGGYGSDQELRLVGEGSGWAIEEGDSLRLHCMFNTSSRSGPGNILYGVGHGMEMCATAVLFEQHDPMHAVSGAVGGNLANTGRSAGGEGTQFRARSRAGPIAWGKKGAAWSKVMAAARAKGMPPIFRDLRGPQNTMHLPHPLPHTRQG